MSHLRVGVDAWGLGGDGIWTGIGQYAASLLRWVPLYAPVDMVAYGAAEDRPTWLPSNVEWRAARPRCGRLTAIASRLGWLRNALSEDGVEVFHSPGVHLRPSFAPVASIPCRSVVTIHDVIPLSFYGSRLPRRNREYYSWNLGRASKADRILTVSESARADIAGFTGLPGSRVEVVTSAVDFLPNGDRSCLAGEGIRGEYLLYAGSYEPRKNLVGMLMAFDRFSAAGGDHSLVVITERSSGHESAVRAVLASISCRSRVHLLHSVPDDKLRALYTHASALIFPSLAEGLGLPPIQAAACGVPMVVSDLPALRETVGEVAIFARPDDPLSLAESLRRVTTDARTREATRRRGPKIAARYSPEGCASDHARIYWSCVESQRVKT